MLHIKRSFLLCFAVFAANLASGQVANSPFSTFGLGDTYGNGLAQHQGMGGVGIGNPSSWYINNQNPALLTYNFVTTFQAGMILENRTINDGSTSLKTGTGNLNYLVLAFPIKSGKWTTSLGLTPFSSANYKLTTVGKVLNDVSSTITSQQTGSGGLNQFYWANGVRVHKNVAVGFRANYLFGSLDSEKTQTISFLNPQDARLLIYQPLLLDKNFIKNFTFSTGVYFHKDSLTKKNFRVGGGFVYDFGAKLNSSRVLRIDQRSIRGNIVDSTTLINNEPSSFNLPQSFGVGISAGIPGRWTVAGDVTISDYTVFNGLNNVSVPTTKGIRGGLGLEYIPNQTSSSSYLRRVTYRTGVSYERYPYLVNGNEVKDLGINFGVSLPVGISTLDLSLKIGKRGSITENSIDENYFKLYFGMTFNDRWFIKRKFD
ncbi:MAG: hypothetical protein HOP30_19700 [Cyclobacteriaceae bacterium]|nr:hypothetical protein [Cyclobacteriaceae bacterium]